jgi:hypothetical protein
MVHYLLSAERRGEPEICEPDWTHRAIHGGEILYEKTGSGIGVQTRYTHPEEVCEIADRLNRLNIKEIGKNWNETAMRQAGVYKIIQMSEDEWLNDLVRLRDFYQLVDAYKEGILFFWK